MFISISHIKRCSAPHHDLFCIEYFDQSEKRLRTKDLQTDMALLVLNFWQRMLLVEIGRRQVVARVYSIPTH
ncbi:unnamed protein product [Echinostoma caproni]|uniref:MAP kinase-activating death domain-containing protein n=1 Tax=Echinostoma caproni TaxID=27848 RepID=A0A183B495_9TREM|nr:unnamed protein product [Echinostoma caproni]